MLPSYKKSAGQPENVVVLVVRARNADENSVPIAYLLIEREVEEKYVAAASAGEAPILNEAELALNYSVIEPAEQGIGRSGRVGTLRAQYSTETGITLPGGAASLDLPDLHGNRIGTYLMYQMVKWIGRWPEAQVQPIRLEAAQATKDNLERRNALFQKAGVAFDFQDVGQYVGISKPVKAGALVARNSWKQNITEVDPRALMARLMFDRESLGRALAQEQLDASRLRHQLNQIKTRPWRLLLDQLPPNWPSWVAVTLLMTFLAVYLLVGRH